jgi:hypothetical protein
MRLYHLLCFQLQVFINRINGKHFRLLSHLKTTFTKKT